MRRRFLRKYELALKIYQMQIMEKNNEKLSFNKIRDYLYKSNIDIPSNVLSSNLYNYVRKGIIKIVKNEEINKNAKNLKESYFTLSEKGIEIVKLNLAKKEKRIIKKSKRKIKNKKL